MKMKRITAMLLAVLLTITAASAALGEAHEILRRGDSGERVAALQKKLIELEYLSGECTGVFDEATEEAVRLFQRQHRLLETGMADRVTCPVYASVGLMDSKAPAEFFISWEASSRTT